jgi:hypothetical protein
MTRCGPPRDEFAACSPATRKDALFAIDHAATALVIKRKFPDSHGGLEAANGANTGPAMKAAR